jgi:RNA polymerase-binding transcription factor DksA
MAATTLDAVRVPASHQTASSLSRLRFELASDREAREALIANHAAAVTELTGHSDSDSILEREFADVSIARASEAIRDIDDALARMDAGTYGLCESCSARIPLERLEAIPHARLCVACSGLRSSVLR